MAFPSITNSAAAPAPARSEPQPAPPAPRPPRRALWFAAVAALAIIFTALWLWTRPAASARPALGQGPIFATVRKGDFVRSLRVHGITEATQFHSVAAPRLSGPGMGSLVITKLSASGVTIKPGDLLVEFDRQAQMKNALDRQAEYRDLVEQIKKKQAEQAATRAQERTELVQAENSVRSSRLELRKNEVVSQIDAEKNQQNLLEAEARLEQLRQTLELKRRAAQAEVRILEIQRDRARKAMDYAQKNMERMAVRAPIAGVVVLNPIWKGGAMGEVQEGDEVRPGVPFLQVVNPQSMQVRARVNQADISYVRKGHEVSITLDAYPDLKFTGRVEQVAAIGVTSGMNSKVRTFQVLIAVQGQDPKLMPDLSAAVDVHIDKAANVLTVPREALTFGKDAAYVFVRRGSSFDKVAVKVGATSDAEAVIESGLHEGDEVLRNPQWMGAQS